MTETKKSGRILWLDVARTLAVISITVNHAVNRAYENYAGQMQEFLKISHRSTMLKAGATVFSHMGVPMFLMITGALLLKKNITDQKDVLRFYKHNLLSIFITTECWFVIMYWVNLFTEDGLFIREQGVGMVILGLIRTMLFTNQLTFSSMWYMPMIMGLYLIVPYLAMILRKVSLKLLILPVILMFIIDMVIPNINSILKLKGSEVSLSMSIYPGYLFGYAMIYLILGYWISRGGLKKIPTWILGVVNVLLFFAVVAFQYWAYSCSYDYLASYDFCLLPILVGCTFELIRRGAENVRKLERPITYLSQISFGIYFVHIVIMSLLYWNIDLETVMPSPAKQMCFLEFISFFGSIPVIWLLSKIPVCKKYLFMIKDGPIQKNTEK